MASVWGELKRRNVVKVAVAYAIVGWLLIEVSTTVLPLFEAPDWIAQVFAFFVILGFPLALILSWAYEITPEGMKRSHEVEATESITHVTGRKLDFAIIGALVLALGFVVYNYVLGDAEEAVGVLPNSVAVIPFDNMSADPEEAYFAAGIHDEIINHLAKLKSLNVIARTSVMQYAGAARPITEIARELNVGTIMEGSVSYAEGRVAIRAQIIDAETGVHLWSDSYNRDFSDVFGIQADIAMNVANALAVQFSLEEQESIERIPTESPAAYAFYLRALTGFGADAISDLDRAITLDPEFALAYATKAFWLAFGFTGVGADPTTRPEREQILQDSADQALALDPTLGKAHAALAGLYQANWLGVEAEQAFQRAYQLSPNDADVVMLYGRFKRYRGEYDESIRLNRRTVELDPNLAVRRVQLAFAYRFAKDHAAAASAFRTAIEFSPTDVAAHINLASAEAALGNLSEAIRGLQLVEQLDPLAYRLPQMALVYKQAGLPEEAARLFSEFEQKADDDSVDEGAWVRAYIAVGDYEQALQRLESAFDNRTLIDVATLTELAANPWSDPELDEPEFRELLDSLWID